MSTNSRWSYKVLDVKPSFLGLKADSVQQALNQLGAQGWELVNAQNIGISVRLYLKKEQ